MKKIEIIWRELLYQSLEQGNNRFVQQELAAMFGFSTSTIFQALKMPRKMGAVRVGGREFALTDPEKLLYHWASVRDLGQDIVYRTSVKLPVMEIESQMVPGVIFSGFSAFRLRFRDAPADYDQVLVYLENQKPKTENSSPDIEDIKQRFPVQRGTPNLTVLKADLWLSHYGQTTTLAQTFVDLWNQDTWYAKEFTKSLRERIDAILS